MTTYVMITTIPSETGRGLAYECQVVRKTKSALDPALGVKRTFERFPEDAIAWARSWVGDRRIKFDGESLVAIRLREAASRAQETAPAALEALKAAEVALSQSRPRADHYDEPVARHAEALRLVRAAISQMEGRS